MVTGINRNFWYRNPEVLYLIITKCKNREIVFLSKREKDFTVRNVHAHFTDFLKKNFEAFHFLEREYNLYYSLAKYDDIRLFNYNPIIRKEQRKVWNKECIKYTKSYDFGLDFDSEGLHDLKKAYNDCMIIKKDFDKYNVPYSIKFSGSKGFHIVVPYEHLPKKIITTDSDEPDNIFIFLKSIAELMKAHYSKGESFMSTLDLGVFDHRRIWKCDYSFVCETGLIALPLSDEQFANWSLDLVKPENVLKMGIRNRGDLTRKGDSTGFTNYCLEVLGIDF